MSALSLPRPRAKPSSRLLAALLAVSLPAGALPQTAAAAPLWAVMAGDKFTPSEAASARKSVQEKAKGLVSGGNGSQAGEVLAEAAAEKGDPVLYIDAAEAYQAAGEKDKSKADLELGIEKARTGLDILHFLQDPRADADWKPVADDEISKEISRAEKVISASEQTIEDLDKKPEEAPKVDDEPKKRKKAPKDGRGLIAAGSLLTLVGVGGLGLMGGGLGMASGAQKDVDALEEDLKNQVIDRPTFDAEVADIDAKGKLGNTLTYAGIAVGVVGLAAGIALLVVGVKKRKKYRAEHGGGEETAGVQLVPVLGAGRAGLVLSGRF